MVLTGGPKFQNFYLTLTWPLREYGGKHGRFQYNPLGSVAVRYGARLPATDLRVGDDGVQECQSYVAAQDT